MAGSVEKIIELYVSGKSIPDVSNEVGVSRSTVRLRLKEAGVLRSRGDGVRLAGDKLGSGMRGKTRNFTDSHRENISISRRRWADENAAGISLKPNGYIEITRGEHKGRLEHDVIMEERIGRRLLSDEIVHHIDHDKINNDIDNLALMTRAAHARLHRREEAIVKEMQS